MRTVLIFSKFFPPMFDVGGKRAYRFAKYLSHFGWKSIIVTDKIPSNRSLDLAHPPLDSKFVNIVREYYPDFFNFYNNPGSDPTNTTPLKTKKFPPKGFLNNLEWQLRWPIASDIWLAPHFIFLTRKLLRNHKIDAIFATSSPYSSLLFGLLAKKISGLPLILDLRDPWSPNFLQKTKPLWARNFDKWAESRILSQADLVTFTSRSTKNRYADLYPQLDNKKKLQYIYNSFDPEMKPKPCKSFSTTVNIVHFGNCYGKRNLKPIITAIGNLVRKNLVSTDDLTLTNYGRVLEEDIVYAKKQNISDFIIAKPAIKYDEGIKLLACSDLQLLSSYGDETLFIPAKLFDYLLSGSEILTLAKKSELTEIIKESNTGYSYDPEDISGIENLILEFVQNKKSGKKESRVKKAVVNRFSSMETAGQLATLLNKITKA